MRLLCLHGYTQSARTFEKKLGALRKAFKQRGIEPVFLDAPHLVPAATESAEALASFDAEQSVEDPDNAPRSWWFARENADGSKTYRLFDETFRYLRDYLENQPPFDGCLGFSQGAALAAVLSIALRHKDVHPAFRDSHLPPFKFVILVGGFPVVDPDLSYFWTRDLADTPALIVNGRADGIVGPERSQPLISAFLNPRVETHEGAHFVPFKASWRQFFCDYILSFDGEGPDSVPSPAGSRL